MSVISLAVISAVVLKFVDWLKQIQNKQWNAVFTQFFVWVVGAGVVLIAAQSQIASGLMLFGVSVRSLSFWDATLVGLAMGSSASVGWQTIGNIGGGNLEVTHPLFPGLTKPTGSSSSTS